MDRWSIGALLLAAVVLLWPGDSQKRPDPGPGPNPSVDRYEAAYDRWRELHRQARADAVDRLRSGELSTAEQTREFLSQAFRNAMRQAFEPLAREEARLLNDNWTPEAHARLLEGHHE